MIVDSSALVAIIKGEPDAPLLLATMREAPTLGLPTPVALEVSLVIGHERVDRAADLIREAGLTYIDFTVDHLLAAQQAHATYGRGSGSKANLNFGDCMSYAVAKVRDEPLLFKGNDFTHTDITPAL